MNRKLRTTITATVPNVLKYAFYSAGDYSANGTMDSLLNADPAHPISVYIGGSFIRIGNPTIGTAASPVLAAFILGGCPDAAHPCSSSTGVYAQNCTPTCPTNVPAVAKPPLYPDALYNQINWSNLTGTSCLVGGKPRFDTNGTGRSTNPGT